MKQDLISFFRCFRNIIPHHPLPLKQIYQQITSHNPFSGEPNNYGDNEDCAETTWDGQWNDNACSLEMGYICERDQSKFCNNYFLFE